MSDDLTSFLAETPDGTAPANADTGKGLRAQLEQALALAKTQAEQIAALTAGSRQREVDDLFKQHAIPDGFRTFFPKEGDVAEAGAKFVAEHGALWGANPQAATTAPEDQSALAAMQAVAAQAQTPALAPANTEQGYREQFAAASTPEEFRRLVEAAALAAHI